MPLTLAKPSLLDALYLCANLRPEDRAEAFALRFDDDPEALAQEILRWGGLAWTARHEGRPAAIFGATQTWPNVWTAWLLSTNDWRHVGRGVTKFIKRRMIPHLMERGALRCEARSMVGHESAHRWLQSLGAVQEARLRRYGRNGEDFLVFRWDPHVHLQSP